MSFKVNEDITDISYHFSDNVISDANISRNLKSLSLTNQYIVPQIYKGRPDLISYALYSSYDYDWLILFINGLTKEELIYGTVINYPSLSSLTNFLLK